MKLIKYKFPTIFILLGLFLIPGFAGAQDTTSSIPKGPVSYEGVRKVNQKSKKKIKLVMNEWSSVKLEYPPMVFSTISNDKSRLELKVVTEIPSVKGIHPVSFRLVLTAYKSRFEFRASEFYFEDIRLSLEKWLEKYGEADNPRNKRNVELITKGIESYIFMSMNQLADKINAK